MSPSPEPAISTQGQEWSHTERQAVVKAIEAFTYQARGRAEATPGLMRKLEWIGRKYRASGFRVAAEFERVLRHVEHLPWTAPCKPVWFVAVLNARLDREIGGPKRMQSEAMCMIQELIKRWPA